MVVFLPGGGHLGRIAYGHPDAKPSDFLVAWLHDHGYACLVPSHPVEHPLFDEACPVITVDDWVGIVVALCEEVIRANALPRRLLVLAWSMAGRYARAINVHAARADLIVDGFIGLAATPPLPGLSPVNLAETPLNATGLRILVDPPSPGVPAYRERWVAALAEQRVLNGTVIVPTDRYLSDYIGNNPVQLHGEAARYRDGVAIECLRSAMDDVGAFRFAELPLCATIAPTAQSDAVHALADRAQWAFLNAHMVAARAGMLASTAASRLSDEAWSGLRSLMDGLPERLCRTVQGNHFFFLGEIGARATVEHIVVLHRALKDVQAEIDDLLRRV